MTKLLIYAATHSTCRPTCKKDNYQCFFKTKSGRQATASLITNHIYDHAALGNGKSPEHVKVLSR